MSCEIDSIFSNEFTSNDSIPNGLRYIGRKSFKVEELININMHLEMLLVLKNQSYI